MQNRKVKFDPAFMKKLYVEVTIHIHSLRVLGKSLDDLGATVKPYCCIRCRRVCSSCGIADPKQIDRTSEQRRFKQS